MRTKIDLSKMGAKVFYQYIYPLVAKEFLFGDKSFFIKIEKIGEFNL